MNGCIAGITTGERGSMRTYPILKVLCDVNSEEFVDVRVGTSEGPSVSKRSKALKRKGKATYVNSQIGCLKPGMRDKEQKREILQKQRREE